MRDKFLVVSNAYPSDSNIYRNGFIHRRVKAYIDKGKDIEVFYLHQPKASAEVYYYENVKVTIGNKQHYTQYLKENDFETYLIHFINPDMYYPIIDNIANPNITVWIHGFEAENWHRRWFNFLENKKALDSILNKAERYYSKQLMFMNEIYSEESINLKFIYVSKWFKERIADVDAKVSPKNFAIIPNIIDGDLFDYRPKELSKRLKILSIRPFASRKYANDQSVKAIQLLYNKPFFKHLEFHIYGDGILFDETLAPISKYDNVHIHRGFLQQHEISNLHKEFGVFLCPTRLDSQGVSMCEAMSSGLVPISSNVTAIPEYVIHKETGLLAESESPTSIAYQIERLYYNKNLFEKISYNSAKSIREIANVNVVINQELEVILNG